MLNISHDNGDGTPSWSVEPHSTLQSSFPAFFFILYYMRHACHCRYCVTLLCARESLTTIRCFNSLNNFADDEKFALRGGTVARRVDRARKSAIRFESKGDSYRLAGMYFFLLYSQKHFVLVLKTVLVKIFVLNF